LPSGLHRHLDDQEAFMIIGDPSDKNMTSLIFAGCD
jgi:hypothetical protein